MTTVERYRSTHLEFHSDATSKPRRTHPSPTSIVRNIPPAVPSPPRLSRNTPPRKPHFKKNLSSAFKMASEESSQWLFTESEIASTPSILDGIVPADERCRRAKGVNFIIQAGILLKLPQLTLATASVFFHRFYMRSSMVPEKGGLHHYNIAATALFLATKTEENCRKTKEIVIAVAKVAQKNASLIIDEQSKEYWRWRDNILLYEELMLEFLTFDVVLQSPYTFLYGFLQKLHIEDNKQLRNVAWSFINDSCLTTMCLLMPPKDIAVAAVYFAAKISRESIPDDENGAPWWEILGGVPERIVKAVGVMNEFWTENPLGKSDNAYGQSPTSSEEDLDRTRRSRDDGSNEHTPSPQDRRNSQDSPNGISQQEVADAPVMNGSKTAEHMSGQNTEAKPTYPVPLRDIPAPTTEDVPATAEAVPPVAVNEPSGSSDSALKAAANDPATHELNGQQNGISAVLSNTDAASKPSPKRKSMDDAEEPPTKRNKPDETAPTAPEESEEGELAES